MIDLKTGEMKFVSMGEFVMGSDKKDTAQNATPPHVVFVNSFYMDTFMVTNEQFLQFSNETGYITTAEINGVGDTFIDNKWQWIEGANWRHPYGPDSYIEDALSHPVVLVSLVDCFAYCKWRSKKEKRYFRLPTEAEWEKAARGKDGRLYPWGNMMPEDGSLDKANFNDGVVKGLMRVDSFPRSASPYQIQCLVGNAWEWCLDVYDETYYYRAPMVDVGGPMSLKNESVFRGGSFVFPKTALVTTERHANNLSRPSVGIGFRTVMPSIKWDSKLLRIYNRRIIHAYYMFKRKVKKRFKPNASLC